MLKVSKLLKATSSECPGCDGTGREPFGACSKCGGSGFLHDDYQEANYQQPTDDDAEFEAEQKRFGEEWQKEQAAKHDRYLDLQDRYGSDI